METQTFDFKRCIELAEQVKATDFAKELEADNDYIYELFVEEFDQLKASEGDYDEDGYGFDDIAECVQNLVFHDETKLLPKPLVDLVCLVYDEAVIREEVEMINNYGALYYLGRMGSVDYAKAEYYYNLASNLGSDISTENLGYIYYYGRTGSVNYAKAFTMFAKGAVFNRPISLYKLGDMYKNGYFVEKSIKTAFKLYQKAESLLDTYPEKEVNDPSPDIYFRLAKCYFYGTGVEVNLRKAFKYFQQAEQGFFEKVSRGDFFSTKLLQETISLEEEVRKQQLARLPKMEWANK